MWESSASKELKAMHLEEDGGPIVSKIAHFESNSKKEFEDASARVKDDEDNVMERKVLEMALKCYENLGKKELGTRQK